MIIGATGLVGSECVRLLDGDETCSDVVVLARSERPSGLTSRKIEWHPVDFNRLESYANLFEVDQIICALGTTRRKTPDKATYRRIDYGYSLAAAKLGLSHGATHYLAVTAVGASSRSRIFYNQLKGELEDDLRKIGYRSLTIARPSVLMGERAEERRSEKLAWKLAFITPRKYRPVKFTAVARSLCDAAREDRPGVRIIDNREILESQ